jgi:hypothetical protein
MTEAAELSNLNALRATAVLKVEASDAAAVFAPKTPLTAHNLTAAQPSLQPSAHSLVTALLTPLLARRSTTALSFLMAAHQNLHSDAQLVYVLLLRPNAQRFQIVQMVNSSAQTRDADASGDMILSSQNLLTTTAWEPRTSAHQLASSAQIIAAKRSGQTARPRTSAQLTLHSSAEIAHARLNQLDQMAAHQPSLALIDLHSSALMVLALVILPSARSFHHALLTLH